jgi:hypothetical protein
VIAALVGLIAGLSSSGTDSATGIPAGTQMFTAGNHKHVAGTLSYDRSPPAGGAHSATWLNCGIYSTPVPNENVVHSLEHGAVWIAYRPDLASADVFTLRQFVVTHWFETQGYLVLSPYAGLSAPIVLSAWGAQLKLGSVSDPRLTEFAKHFEGGGQGGERGGECVGGVGTPN